MLDAEQMIQIMPEDLAETTANIGQLPRTRALKLVALSTASNAVNMPQSSIILLVLLKSI